MDPTRQDKLSRNSERLVSEFQPSENALSNTPESGTNSKRVNSLGGDTSNLPASVKGASWKHPRPIERFFAWMLRNLLGGSLQITFPSGAQTIVCDRGFPLFQLKIKNPHFFNKVLSGGSVGFWESYVNGDWDTPDLSGLLLLLAKNQKDLSRVGRGFSIIAKQANRIYHKARRNNLGRSKENTQAQ